MSVHRWLRMIEVTFREVKECLWGEGPQSWKGDGPERAAALSLWLYSAIWTWHITMFGTTAMCTPRPWYPKKATIVPRCAGRAPSHVMGRTNYDAVTRQAGALENHRRHARRSGECFVDAEGSRRHVYAGE